MASLNKVLLIGNVGKDPEQRGQAVGFSLATTEKWKDKDSGEVQERTDWHRCVVFGKAADTFMRFVKKGTTLYVEGAVRYREWQDKEGNKRMSTDIVVSDFKFLGGTKEQSQQTQRPAQSKPAQQPSRPGEPEDDFPFA